MVKDLTADTFQAPADQVQVSGNPNINGSANQVGNGRNSRDPHAGHDHAEGEHGASNDKKNSSSIFGALGNLQDQFFESLEANNISRENAAQMMQMFGFGNAQKAMAFFAQIGPVFNKLQANGFDGDGVEQGDPKADLSPTVALGTEAHQRTANFEKPPEEVQVRK